MATRVLGGLLVTLPAAAPLSRLGYQWRFTLTEQIALEMAMESFPDAEVRAALRVLDKSLTRVEEKTGVSVNDDRTDNGAWYAVGVLATLGVVENTEPAIAARVAELLTPPG
jgi:hypothetical protein